MTKSTTKKATTKSAAAKSSKRIVTLPPVGPDDAQQVKIDAASLVAKIIASATKIEDSTKAQLANWIELGNDLIEYRAQYLTTGLGTLNSRATDKNPMGSFLAYWQASDFGYLSTNTVGDAIYIAENSAIVNAETRKDIEGNLTGLSSDNIKKKIKSTLDAKDPAKTKAAKDKAAKLKEATAKTKAAKKAAKKDGSVDLSKLMEDPKAFGELIAGLVNKNYNDIEIQAFAHAMAKNVVIDLRQ
jgi:hypothetical protein